MFAIGFQRWQSRQRSLGFTNTEMKPLSKYDGAMDAECVKLCDALNRMPGIMTLESCSGHGERPFYIAFTAASMNALFSIVAKISTDGVLRIEALLGNGGELSFKLIGAKGLTTYSNALELGTRIEADL